MKVILRKDVYNLGSLGEIVAVKDGYARNYLIPRNLAFFASTGALRALEIEKKQNVKRQAKEKAGAEVVASKLAEMQISIPMKVGEEGKLYGSVTPAMIAQELSVHGLDIDRRQVVIEDPIKSLGVFDIKIRLHTDVMATLKVWVINEE
jgi:large subunit ribosomal protein L9